MCTPSHVDIDIIWFLAPSEGMDMLIILIWYVSMKALGHIPCIHSFKTVSIIFLEDSAITEAMFLCLNIIISLYQEVSNLPLLVPCKIFNAFLKINWCCSIMILYDRITLARSVDDRTWFLSVTGCYSIVNVHLFFTHPPTTGNPRSVHIL